MAGPLKTLLGALQASSFLSGTTVVFGDEETNTQRFPLPLVVMIARGGSYDEPGTATRIDPATEMIWQKYQTIEFRLFAASSDPVNQGAVDHADAIETLRANLLSALRDQRAQYTDVNSVAHGLFAKPMSGDWMSIAQNAPSRYGRVYVLTCMVLIPILMSSIQGGPEATVTSVQVTPAFNDGPAL